MEPIAAGGKECAKVCDESQICNPASGRCVKRDGKIGKELIASASKTKSKKVSPKTTQTKPQKNSPSKTKKSTSKDCRLESDTLCKEDTICNPNTGKCVKRNGKIGKQILADDSTAPLAAPKVQKAVTKKVAPKKAAAQRDDTSVKPQKKPKVPVDTSSGCHVITAENSSRSLFEKYSKRPSPPIPANECPVGYIAIGNDGLEYITKPFGSKQTNRWVKN